MGERGHGPHGWPESDPHPADLLRAGALRQGPGHDRLVRIGLGRPCAAVNLLLPGPAGRWTREEKMRAARAARDLRLDWTGRFCLVVLLGRQVAAAFGMARAPPASRQGRFLILPHPSGRARWWNAPGREEMAAACVRRALADVGARRECCGGGCY